MKDRKQYYKELGKLVYTVAVADGVIQEEEINTLHSYVSKELAKYEPNSDSSGMNYAFYTDFEFESVSEKKPEIDTCVRSYTEFIEKNYERGDDDLIRRSMNLLEHVAKAYLKQREKQIISLVKTKINRISGSIFNINNNDLPQRQ